MREDEIAITVRFPRELREAIKQRADNARRSFNGEVVWELEHYTAAPGPKMGSIPNSKISPEDLQQTIPEVEEAWKRYSAKE